MKKVFINLFQWIASLFKKNKTVTLTSMSDKTIQVETELETEIEWGTLPDNPIYEAPLTTQHSTAKVEEVEKVEVIAPVVEEKTETTPKTSNRKLTHVKIWSVGLNGKVHQLTNKQFLFYTNIAQYGRTELGGARTKDFIKGFYQSIEANIPKENDDKMRLGYHNKTMKYLLKSGLVTKVKKGIYKANK